MDFLEAFTPSRTEPGGRKRKGLFLLPYKSVEDKRINARRWREAHPDYQKQWHAEHPTYRAEWLRFYKRDHPEIVAAAHKKWRLANGAKKTAWVARWRRENREKALEAWRRNAKARYARLRGAPVSDLTPAQWAAILEAYNLSCAYCGSKISITLDHIIPVSRDGSHTASNVVPACLSCNTRKGARPAPDFQMRLQA